MTDKLMQSLGQVAREQAEDATEDDRWMALCANELPAAEEEALRRQARTSESTRRAVEVFEPLGPEFRAGIVRRLRQQIATTAIEHSNIRKAEPHAAEPDDAAHDGAVPGDDAPDDTEPGDTEPGARSAAVWWRLPTAASAVAAAAAIVIALVWPRVELQPIPAYQLALQGGASISRAAEPPAAPRFVAGSPFKLVLRPETAVAGPVDGPPVSAHAFLGHGQTLKRWDVTPQVSDQGTVLIAGTLGDEIRLDTGQNLLSIVIGRRGKLPGAETVRAISPDDLESRQTRDWLLLRLVVTVAEDPPG